MEQTLPYHSNPDFIAAFNANLDRDSIPGCALWRGALSTGYGRTQLPDGRIRPAHAVALEIHLGRELAAGEGWGGKLQANHRDDLCQRRDCCSAAHLYEGTHKQNIHDSIASGRSTKGKKLPVEVLTATDIQALLRACNRGPTGARNQALIILLWRGGLRISEALALRPTDIDIERGTISVLRGKGSKQRQAALDPWAAGILKNWLTIRSPLPGSTAFCTLDGSPIGLSYIRALLPRLARIAGVEKRVHAHAFRHTHAVELMQERVPLNLISKQLGHSNVATTAVYLAHVSPPEMLAAVQSRPPPF